MQQNLLTVSCQRQRRALLSATIALFFAIQSAKAGTWTPLATNAPGGVQLMLLLSDGTVMCFDGNTTAWFKLTPNSSGSYINGTWTTLASMSFSRRYLASQVLQNGKVMVAGAEYGTGGATTELYDPPANTWTEVIVPAGLLLNCPQTKGNGNFRDAGSMMLPIGTMMVAPVCPGTPNRTLIYDPIASTWSNGPAYLRNQNEASWVKLPDDSIVTVDTSSTQSERFIPSLNRWINDSNLPVNLYGAGSEIGPGLLLPDRRAFFLGGSTNTAFYTPTGTTNPGAWTSGPPFPNGQACPDAPAAMLVNGKVLFASSAVGTSGNPFPTNVSFYEYDPVGNSYARQNSPTGGLTENNIPVYQAALLCLPDGNVLYSDESSQLYVYTPTGSPIVAGKPTINTITLNPDGSYHLTGTKLNGISAGAAYGDDEQMDSNYPLVRLTDGSGNVYYARTYNWSSTGVQTGSTPVTTEFSLPDFVFANGGTYSLVVVANGISSDPVSFSGPVWVDFNSPWPFEFGTYSFPDKTLAKGTNDVAAGGAIFIKPGTSHETFPMTITKPMSITAIGGSAIIGH